MKRSERNCSGSARFNMGRTKVGVFRMGFFWVLDTNGNQSLDAGIDQAFAFGGITGDKPVVGKW